MEVVICLLSLVIVIDVYRVSILLFRKDSSFFKLFFEFIILISLVSLCFIDISIRESNSFSYICFVLSIIFSLYVVLCFITSFKDRKNFISVLSIKSAVDKSLNGIMFLDNRNNIFLINKVMERVLAFYNINDDFINNLNSNVFKCVNNDKFLRCLDKVWLLKIYNDREVVVVDVTDIYALNEKLEGRNAKLDRYNKKLVEALDNVEKINKSKNLVKIKNEFHDLLGHRLSLFHAYLNSGNANFNDIKFMINNLFYEDASFDDPSDKLGKLIDIYRVLGVNINLDGVISNDNFGRIYFEVIREAVTNAIRHGGSKNIDIIINDRGMIISNDGDVFKGEIHENEGIKGMRRKLNEIGGSLIIDTSDGFVLRINV